MASFNRVILMGNLTRDPEVRFTNSGMAVCNIGLAVNRRIKDQQTEQWREEPTFVDVTIFGKRGEAFAKFHNKGKAAFIEGELRYDTWEDKNGGGKRSKLYVVGNTWEFVGGGKEGGGGGGSANDSSANDSSANDSGGYGEQPSYSSAPSGGPNMDTPF